MFTDTRWVALLLLTFTLSTSLPAQPSQSRLSEVTTFDGLGLPAVCDLPAGPVKRVIVLLHGSGAHSQDQDLGVVTKEKQSNPLFLRLGQELARQGWATLRFDKRAWVVSQRLSEDPQFTQHPVFQNAIADPYGTLLKDAQSAVETARQEFPGVPVYLLGHSEGAYFALQVAYEDPDIAGVALIGFYFTTSSVQLMEQVVHRGRGSFQGLDQDQDGALSTQELASDGPFASALRAQLEILDLNGDTLISLSEFLAGQASNLLVLPEIFPSSYLVAEVQRPSPRKILEELTIPVLFFSGEWDNQTPAYQTRAVEIAERQVWKKGNRAFHYFPRAGHALDERESYEDIVYTVTPQQTIETVVRTLDEFFQR
jgi:pimeloyl-ACP methyl ester carboxylesterase